MKKILFISFVLMLLITACNVPTAIENNLLPTTTVAVQANPSPLPASTEQPSVLIEEIKDPANDPDVWAEGAWSNMQSENNMGQTFTATTDLINFVQINVYPIRVDTIGNTILLTITDSNNSPLASSNVSVPGGWEGWITFEIPNGLKVTSEQEYRIMVSEPQDRFLIFGWKFGIDEYKSGSAITLGEINSFSDFYFRINPTPEEILAARNPQPQLVAYPTTSFIPKPNTIDDFIMRCPTAEEVAMVDNAVPLYFEADPTADQIVCTAAQSGKDLSVLQKGAYQTIVLMKLLEFDQPLPWTDKSLYDWFTSITKGIRFRADIDNGFCCQPASVINLPTNIYHNLRPKQITQWIDPQSGTGLTQGLLTIMVHESRHIESGPHTCGTRDNTIAELNAQGAIYYLNYWLAYHSNPYFFYSEEINPNYYREISAGVAEAMKVTAFCAEPASTPGPTPTLPPIKNP